MPQRAFDRMTVRPRAVALFSSVPRARAYICLVPCRSYVMPFSDRSRSTDLKKNKRLLAVYERANIFHPRKVIHITRTKNVNYVYTHLYSYTTSIFSLFALKMIKTVLRDRLYSTFSRLHKSSVKQIFLGPSGLE